MNCFILLGNCSRSSWLLKWGFGVFCLACLVCPYDWLHAARGFCGLINGLTAVHSLESIWSYLFFFFLVAVYGTWWWYRCSSEPPWAQVLWGSARGALFIPHLLLSAPGMAAYPQVFPHTECELLFVYQSSSGLTDQSVIQCRVTHMPLKFSHHWLWKKKDLCVLWGLCHTTAHKGSPTGSPGLWSWGSILLHSCCVSKSSWTNKHVAKIRNVL